MIHHRSGPTKPLSQDAIGPTKPTQPRETERPKGQRSIGLFVGLTQTRSLALPLVQCFNQKAGLVRSGSPPDQDHRRIRITAGKVRIGSIRTTIRIPQTTDNQTTWATLICDFGGPKKKGEATPFHHLISPSFLQHCRNNCQMQHCRKNELCEINGINRF